MRRFAWSIAVVVGWMSAASLTAHAEEPSFRDLVRKYVAGEKSAGGDQLAAALPDGVDKIVALEYTVLLQSQQGEEAVDASKYQFRVGDRIRVRIKPLSGLYIYIFHEGASGHRTCLLPTEKETPPLARPDKSIDLPSDGSVFEFSPPAGEEKLIVVALEKPSEDLAALSDVIFKKPDEKLSDDEKKIQDSLKARSQSSLKSILERQAQGTKYRGLFSDKTIANVGKEMKEKGVTRAMMEEPPHGTTRSTFALSAGGKSAGGELYVTIPLRSTGK